MRSNARVLALLECQFVTPACATKLFRIPMDGIAGTVTSHMHTCGRTAYVLQIVFHNVLDGRNSFERLPQTVVALMPLRLRMRTRIADDGLHYGRLGITVITFKLTACVCTQNVIAYQRAIIRFKLTACACTQNVIAYRRAVTSHACAQTVSHTNGRHRMYGLSHLRVLGSSFLIGLNSKDSLSVNYNQWLR